MCGTARLPLVLPARTAHTAAASWRAWSSSLKSDDDDSAESPPAKGDAALALLRVLLLAPLLLLLPGSNQGIRESGSYIFIGE